MTEAISRNEPRQSTNDNWSSSTSTDVQSSNAPTSTELECRAPPDDPALAQSEELPPAVSLLVSRSQTTRPAATTSEGSSEPKPKETNTNNNSQRTAATELGPFYARAGATSAGDSVYAGAAWLKGHADGGNFEFFSASAQLGAQTEFQAGLARVGMSSDWGSWEVRTLEADAHIGVHNPDGSTGLNAGLAATAIAAETTLKWSGNSLTVGGALGVGGDVAVGKRDADNDGNIEYCARVAYQVVIGGACIEPESVAAAAGELYEKVATRLGELID